MAAVLRSVAHVPACGERRSLQPNSYLQNRNRGYNDTACDNIEYVRISKEYFENNSRKQLLPLSRPTAESDETGKSLSGRSSFRIPRSSARLSEFRRSLAQQNVIFKSARFVHENHSSFVTDLPPTHSPARRASILCRVHSVEGAEKASTSDTNIEEKGTDLLTERQEGGGDAQEEGQQEGVPLGTSRGSAQQDDLGSSEEKRILETVGEDSSGSPQNGNISVTSHQDSNDISGDRAAGAIPTEELKGFETGQDWDEEVKYVTRISVPRQKYIPVTKVDLVNALLLLFFPAEKDASNFLSLCSYLEIILHAEHKVLLEELRSDYSLTHSGQVGNKPESGKLLKTRGVTNSSKLSTATNERAQKHEIIGEQADWPKDSPQMEGGTGKRNRLRPLKVLADLGTRFTAPFKQQNSKDEGVTDTVEDASEGPSSDADASEAAAERFQKNILRMLGHAEFEGISVRDLELTAALNPDYLLTLPVDVDWKRTSLSNAKIFRRGYTKEEQKGLLLGAKLDYLQSLILRQTFKGFTGPLLNAGRWCIQKWRSLWNDKDGREMAESVSRWLQEPLQMEKEEPLNPPEQSTDHETFVDDREAQLDMPIWLAARQAIPRYEAVLSSAGSRGMLIRRILMRMGLLQPEPPPLTLQSDGDESLLEPYMRPSHLSRVSMKDIWQPASEAVVGRNILRKISAAFSVFFSQATLQEPAFKELVLLYNADGEDETAEAGLQLQTYKRIPLPDLKMVFPSKKLMFRVLDTLRLDITSIAGLLAFLVNYRFDDFFSSPSAFVIDLVATSALVVFVTRVGFGYKQVWDRYQLLVNKTLYEKTLARGFGVVQFLVDESEDQQFKEAILVFLLLVNDGKAEGMTMAQLADFCERFLYYRCKEQVEMPVENAVNTLLKFGLIASNEETAAATSHNADVRFRAVSYEQGLRALEQHWLSLPSSMSLWN